MRYLLACMLLSAFLPAMAADEESVEKIYELEFETDSTKEDISEG